MNKVYTGGTFDLLHPGHMQFLRACRKLAGEGGQVWVGVNRDEFVLRYKGHPPLYTVRDRIRMLHGLRSVDSAYENIGDEDSRPLIERLKPDIVAIGEDWARRDYHQQMGFDRAWLRRLGITLVYIAFEEPEWASSSIKTSLSSS